MTNLETQLQTLLRKWLREYAAYSQHTGTEYYTIDDDEDVANLAHYLASRLDVVSVEDVIEVVSEFADVDEMIDCIRALSKGGDDENVRPFP